MANGPKPSMARRGSGRHDTPGRAKVMLRAWPPAQAWPLGPISGLNWPNKHNVSSRPASSRPASHGIEAWGSITIASQGREELRPGERHHRIAGSGRELSRPRHLVVVAKRCRFHPPPPARRSAATSMRCCHPQGREREEGRERSGATEPSSLEEEATGCEAARAQGTSGAAGGEESRRAGAARASNQRVDE